MGRLQLVERPRRVHVHAALAVLLLLAGCGSGGPGVRVFAAASLTDVLTELGGAEYAFDGSAALLRQLRDGARADALVTADRETMDAAVQAGLARDPVAFAGNRLVIVVARGNPERVRSLADLRGLRVALAGPGVPAGRYAAEAFRLAGVAVPRASEETSVRAVVAKVAMGEADAGVAYRTDVAGDVEAVEIAAAHRVPVSYHAAALTPRGREFVESLLSGRARALLDRHGFTGPP